MSFSFKNRPGAAALLTTIIFGLLLVAVVTALTTITTRESRQAADSEQGKRAYAVAESGIQRAASLLDRGVAGNNTVEYNKCLTQLKDQQEGGSTELGTSNKVELDCVVILDRAKDTTGFLRDDYQYLVQTVAGASGDNDKKVRGIKIEYHNPTLNDEKFNKIDSLNGALPGSAGSSWNRPATLLVEVGWWKKGSNALEISAEDFINQYRNSFPINANDTTKFNGSEIKSSCDVNKKEYQCSIVLNEEVLNKLVNTVKADGTSNDDGKIDTKNIIFKVKALNKPVHYKVTYYNDSSLKNPITVPQMNLRIEATGRSGEIERKAVAYKPRGFYPYPNIADGALYSGGKVCMDDLIYAYSKVLADAGTCETN